MKTRKKALNTFSKKGPAPFDFTLLSELYIHQEGDDVLDFGGERGSRGPAGSRRGNRNVSDLHRSNASGSHTDTWGIEPILTNGTFLNLQYDPSEPAFHNNGSSTEPTSAADTQGTGSVNSSPSDDDEADFPYVAPNKGNEKNASHLVRIEDDTQHIWLVMQPHEDEAPSARHFSGPREFISYVKRRRLKLPDEVRQNDDPFHSMSASCESTKWVDIQLGPTVNPANSDTLKSILALFPIHEDTMDHFLYIGGEDRVDTSFLGGSDNNEKDYLFINLNCTPLNEKDDMDDDDGGIGSARSPTRTASPSRLRVHNINTTKSLMEMRFDAVLRMDEKKVHVPDPVTVAVIAFKSWIITVHKGPFAEMDDLLRVIQLRCFPEQFKGRRLWHPSEPAPGAPRERFTSSFVLTSLFQITVGHHVDPVSLTEAINEVGDDVFNATRSIKDQEKVLIHITALRNCCGECNAEVNRRENMVRTILQPQLASHPLLSDAYCREQLKLVKVHLQGIQQDLNNCRDTVSLYNWYHNIAAQWYVLRRGNRALRMLLLITECANIMYPILMIQTLYAMNVLVPFDSEGDPPNSSLVPFFVLFAIFAAYCFWCGRAVARVFTRKHFDTQLLA